MGTVTACCKHSTKLCMKEPWGVQLYFFHREWGWRVLTVGAWALAAGLDAQSQSRQVGEQPLEVEGGQRRACILRGLLQPGKGRRSRQNLRPGADAKEPPAGVGRAGAARPQGNLSVPGPQGPPRLPGPLPGLSRIHTGT